MDWEKLKIFRYVAQEQSFTHAGIKLNLSQSAASRQIKKLEEEVGVILFHRHARGLLLTEQGETLLKYANEVFDKISSAENSLTVNKEKPQGSLRVTTTIAFGSVWLTSHIDEFLEKYPEISVTLIVGDFELDLGMREADIAIRLSPPRQPYLIQRHLFTGHMGIFASNDYIEKNGAPNSVEDLLEHRIVSYGDSTNVPFPGTNWLTNMLSKLDLNFQPVFSINNIVGMIRAVESGIGIAALPTVMVREISSCTQILQDIEGPPIEAFFVYPAELRSTRRVTVFRDFILQKVKNFEF
jgi:DNA-binding transcriptional LysR family regulator